MYRRMLALSRNTGCVGQARTRAPNAPSRRACACAVQSVTARSASEPSTSYAQPFPLRSREVAVWWLDPSSIPRSAAEKHAHWLNAEELMYIMASSEAQVQHERLCARVMIRSAIATCLGPGVKLSDLSFRKSIHGKPELVTETLPKRAKGIDFNHTNTAGLIGVAVAVDVKVGIDVERINRVPYFGALKTSKRMFSDAEVSELSDITNLPQQQRHFVQQWTLKEAFVKATGRGMSAAPGTKAFSIVTADHDEELSLASLVRSPGLCLRDAPRPLAVSSHVESDAASSFALLQFRPSEDHVGSLCVQVETEDGTKTGGDQSMTWDSLGVTMWSGMPGLNYSVVESRSPITATT